MHRLYPWKGKVPHKSVVTAQNVPHKSVVITQKVPHKSVFITDFQ